MNNIPENYDEFYMLLFGMIDNERKVESLAGAKEYLQEIDHPQKDNASFVYDFYQFLTEDFCVNPNKI